MGFTEKQGAMVKESWVVLKEDIPHNSFRFFSLILETAPVAKGMFSFLKDSDEIPKNNTKLKAHAVIVFKLTCESAVQLSETGKVEIKDSLLKWLGTVHHENGVVDPHFEVVKEALLRTIKEALGDAWNEEVNDAWSEAYDQLALVIKNAMKEKAEQLG